VVSFVLRDGLGRTFGRPMTVRKQRGQMKALEQFILKARNIFAFTLIALASIMLLGLGNSYMLSNTSDDISKTLITAFSSLLGSVALIVFGKLVEQKANIENDIRKKKLPVYEEFLKTLFDAGFRGNNGAMNEDQKRFLIIFHINSFSGAVKSS
jgi:hypothetical protein